MVSNISTTGLDEQFPVAGRDNDSQGFRDNFANIKTNLDYAKTEIDDLQEGVARKDTDNNFDGNTIINAVAQQLSYKTSVQGALNGGNWNDASVQVYEIDSTDITVSLDNFPTENYGFIKCFFNNIDSVSHTVEFTNPSALSLITDGNIKWSGNSIELDPGDKFVVDVYSTDANNFYLNIVFPIASAASVNPSLENVTNVNISSIQNAQPLIYDSVAEEWINSSIIKRTDGTSLINLSTGVVSRPDGTSLLDTTNDLIKRSDGTTLIDTDTGAIKRSDGTTLIDTGTGAIKRSDGSVIVDTDGTLRSSSGDAVFDPSGVNQPTELVIPSFTSTERDDGTVTQIKEGAMIYNTDLEAYQIYVGGLVSGSWRSLPTTNTTSGGGISAPSYTTAERDALTPSAGDIIFNNDTNKHQGYDGSTWNNMY